MRRSRNPQIQFKSWSYAHEAATLSRWPGRLGAGHFREARIRRALGNANLWNPRRHDGAEFSVAAAGDPSIDKRINTYLVEGDSPKRDGAFTPKFAKGDKVFVKNVPTIEHTRLPGYLRDRIGIVDVVYPGNYTYLTSTGPDGVGDAM